MPGATHSAGVSPIIADRLQSHDTRSAHLVTRRPLQVAMAVLGLVPVLTGVVSMRGVGDPLCASAGLFRVIIGAPLFLMGQAPLMRTRA